MSFEIRTGTPLDAYQVAQEIPEFGNEAYDLLEYQTRLTKPSLVLIGYNGPLAVAFKAGYQRGAEDHFYSWMGGVVPAHRQQGWAQALAEKQEAWARDQGFIKVWFKTRNRNRHMIQFAVGRGFNITEVQPRTNILDNRIILEKPL